MIAYLEGHILLVEADFMVLKTIGGVGYQVFATQKLIAASKVGELLEVYTYANIREDEFSLYAFASMVEKKVFELLIRTSGIGPKLGIAILSHLPVPTLIQAIQQENIATLSTVPGVGKKTATKLCLDMKDLLKKHPLHGLENLSGSSTVHASSGGESANELISALTNMGFAERDIFTVLGQVQSEHKSFEAQFKKALSLLTSMR
ncbi:Holliday junction branch migration protein RuvA [Deltaproteobacteria bacterium TL4]